jgi:hypothetical protein
MLEGERIQRDLAQLRTQLGLMYELLATATGEEGPVQFQPQEATKSVRQRVVEEVGSILRDRGAPMRIQDIHAEFLRRKFQLPGSGTPANIAAHLVDRKVFSRPRRGVFALAEWNGEQGEESVV